jgi:hypothetical protein
LEEEEDEDDDLFFVFWFSRLDAAVAFVVASGLVIFVPLTLNWWICPLSFPFFAFFCFSLWPLSSFAFLSPGRVFGSLLVAS